MKIRYAMVTIVLAFCSQVARAEQPPDRSRLIGTTVYSSDGADIGTIADVRLDEAGRLASLRINAGTRLGFGVHQVELPGSSVTM